MIRVFAPAKINLTLKVGPPRADGMHPLESVVVFADIGDWIEAAPAEDLTLALSGPFAGGLAADENNLVLRAADLLRERAGGRGAALMLEKNLPIASGIGGGSSDAAATLKALNQLWRLNLSEAELCVLARRLGADAPVCVHGRAAFMQGIGADWSGFPAPAFDAVLANPLRPVPTGDVYRRFDQMGGGGGFSPRGAPHWPDRAAALAAIAADGNDLCAAACALEPEIGVGLAVLRADARVRACGLSGSGGTIFAIVEDAAAAKSVAGDLAHNAPHWWIRAVQFAAS